MRTAALLRSSSGSVQTIQYIVNIYMRRRSVPAVRGRRSWQPAGRIADAVPRASGVRKAPAAGWPTGPSTHGIRLRYEYIVTTFALRMPHTSSTSGRPEVSVSTCAAVILSYFYTREYFYSYLLPEVSVSTCATVLLLDFYSNLHVITS